MTEVWTFLVSAWAHVVAFFSAWSWTNTISLLIGLHLPAPGYAKRLWMRFLHLFGLSPLPDSGTGVGYGWPTTLPPMPPVPSPPPPVAAPPAAPTAQNK